ncbi:MAG: hypothetical protein ACTS4V_00095 [Candidatus Hodgkinia cicadicola]
MRLATNGRLVKFNTTIIPRREFSFANYDWLTIWPWLNFDLTSAEATADLITCPVRA